MNPVMLHDGRQVSSSSEDWRAECEARLVLAWPLHKRREYIASLEVKRGKAAQDVLKARMTAIHASRQPSRSTA